MTETLDALLRKATEAVANAALLARTIHGEDDNAVYGQLVDAWQMVADATNTHQVRLQEHGASGQ